MSNKTIAFIGLGVMGAPMAGHLSNAGHNLRIYNRSTDKSQAWLKQYNGAMFTEIASAINNCDVVISCVGDDKDLRDVATGNTGIIENMPSGGLFIDHSSVSAAVSKEINALCKARNIAFVDAPVSGGQAGAENGQLSIMVGGTNNAVERANPIMQSYAKSIVHIGDTGSGQLAKSVNQICAAGVIQGLAEGMHFAQQNGLDIDKVFTAVSQGAAGSWQMSNRYKTMADDAYDFGFAVDWMVKDLNIALATASDNNAELPVTEIIRGYYQSLQKSGHSRSDTSVLLKRLQNLTR